MIFVGRNVDDMRAAEGSRGFGAEVRPVTGATNGIAHEHLPQCPDPATSSLRICFYDQSKVVLKIAALTKLYFVQSFDPPNLSAAGYTRVPSFKKQFVSGLTPTELLQPRPKSPSTNLEPIIAITRFLYNISRWPALSFTVLAGDFIIV